ncbi:MAG TPA: CsgG/HfaB family protein [Bacteroidales bacterium]|nr:CsgG/HfaB family protein [Bacteroidales bacterium]
MKKPVLVFFFLINFLILSFSQEKIKLAVLDFKVIGINIDLALAIYDEFVIRLIDSGKFTVAEREDLKKVMNELSLQNQDEFDESSSVEIGKYLGAEIVLFGKIQKIASKYRLSIKGVEVKTATAAFAKLITVENEDLLFDNIPLLINQIIDETTGGVKKEEQKILNKEKQQKIEEINNKINSLKDNIKIMEEQNKDNKTMIIGSLAGMGTTWGLFGLSVIGTSVGFGLMGYYYEQNQKAETMSMIDQYASYGSTGFWAGVGFSIGAVVTLIPALALTGYYAHISGFERNIDKKRKELQKLELDKQKLTLFDIKINKDNIAFAFTIKL